MAMHRFDPAIFREYDIRGAFGENLRAEDAYLIARAFAAGIPLPASSPQAGVMAENTPPAYGAGKGGGCICVCRDGRLSSPELHEAVCRGVTESGVDVMDIGIGPTPMLYFAAHMQKTAGAMMITGSHNPPADNGLKFVLGGKAFYGADIQALKKKILEGFGIQEKKGKISTRDVREDYVDALASAYGDAPWLNVAWDGGNGAAGEIMAALAARLPGTHMLLNERIDGAFPAHHPDPSVPENLAQLIHAVRGGTLDAGIAFDGDGDRLGVVDDEGMILSGDHLLMLYAEDVLKHTPGAMIIADVKASGAVFEEIARLGGKPLMWKTGHSNIKAKMAETGAAFAGEMSGHMFFADKYYGYDDGIYAAVRLLALLSRSGKKLSELRKALPARVSTPELRFACDDARKFKVIDEVRGRLKQAATEFNDVDGVRVSTRDGWWLLRASNTQAALVARAEARDAAGLSRLKEDLRRQLSFSKVALPC
ncbi:MAG: phosphomannomutase/phosphoglucomutase [Pseudomonadota bacterium]|nr:phosphomannomutase/phosphoglucomutase [Pseudomonadota bacterium]MDE3037109.1 phosphomannomutase/phosphoglucomutase [Pseudomonadota bacterium]